MRLAMQLVFEVMIGNQGKRGSKNVTNHVFHSLESLDYSTFVGSLDGRVV